MQVGIRSDRSDIHIEVYRIKDHRQQHHPKPNNSQAINEYTNSIDRKKRNVLWRKRQLDAELSLCLRIKMMFCYSHPSKEKEREKKILCTNNFMIYYHRKSIEATQIQQKENERKQHFWTGPKQQWHWNDDRIDDNKFQIIRSVVHNQNGWKKDSDANKSHSKYQKCCKNLVREKVLTLQQSGQFVRPYQI